MTPFDLGWFTFWGFIGVIMLLDAINSCTAAVREVLAELRKP